MKYLKVTVLVGINEVVIKEFSEGADLTRYLDFIGLHRPSSFIYLHNHDEFPNIDEKDFKKMHQCIDEQGGI